MNPTGGISVAEYQWLINALFGLCTVLGGLILKAAWDEVKSVRASLDAEIKSLREALAIQQQYINEKLAEEVKSLREALSRQQDYINERHVQKDDFREFRDEVREGLQRIFDRLDRKVDKTDKE